jgi:cytoskeletal protein CcmA (bactofilin family)
MFEFAIRQPAVETIIGAGSFLRGEVASKGTVRIDGTFEGRVRADWIVVGESGVVGGAVICRGMIVGGKIEGTIHAGELVDIKTTGSVSGDIYARRLAVSEGGVFEGHSYMNKAREAENRSVLPLVSEK